ncbi:MAG TPA: glycosyltransferase family 1 protein, partial [Chitinophagaceae bacterium]|nr:glycosyltransferase family 1 protein [Chitinophagaceae bacterium]
ILVSGVPKQSLPEHSQVTAHRSKISVHRFLRPQTIFWQLQDYLRAKLQASSVPFGKNTIWHATYFHLPEWWQGAKIVTVYDLIHEQFPHFFNHNYDEILRKRKKRSILAADKVICISESVRSEVIERYGIPNERAVAIPLAYAESFRRLSKEEISPGHRVDYPFILYVGMRQHYKNFRTLLAAYSSWPHRNEIKLLVIGPPWIKEEHAEIALAGLASNVILRSGITDEELCALYNQALAFVYPSLSEGFGIPLLEAMACGCPIVASRIPIFTEVARDVPYFFEPLDKNELITALDAACVSRVSARKVNTILESYSWDRAARETLKIYEDLASC